MSTNWDVKEIKIIAGRAIDSITRDGGTGLNWILLRECVPIGCVSKNDIYKMLRSSNVNKADLLKYVLSQEYIAQSDWGADILKRVMGSDVNLNDASLFLNHVFNEPHWSAHEKAPEFYEKIFANLDGADAEPLIEALLDKNSSQENCLALAKGVLAQEKWASNPWGATFLDDVLVMNSSPVVRRSIFEILLKEKHWREHPKIVEVCPQASIDCILFKGFRGELNFRSSEKELAAFQSNKIPQVNCQVMKSIPGAL